VIFSIWICHWFFGKQHKAWLKTVITEDTSCKKLLCIAASNLEKTYKWIFLRNRTKHSNSFHRFNFKGYSWNASTNTKCSTRGSLAKFSLKSYIILILQRYILAWVTRNMHHLWNFSTHLAHIILSEFS
jgi:hypothetical protein